VIGGEWRQLGDLTEADRPITYGVVKPGEEPEEGGVILIRGGDIAKGRIAASLRRITEEVSRPYKRTLLKGGELVMSLVGNPGAVAVVPQELRGANLARQAALIALRPEVESRYLMYWFMAPAGQQRLAAVTKGSVQQVINLADLKRQEVLLPPIETQRRIAGILGAYDDLIEVNRRRVAVLEAQARGLFEEWFVALRFPGHETTPQIQTPDGPLPQGWSEQLLIEIASVNYGKNLPKNKLTLDGKYPVYGASKIIGMYDNFTHAERVVLVGCRGTVGQFQISKPYSFITNNSFSIAPVVDVNFAWLFFALMKRGIAETISGSAQPQITLQGISKVCLAKPTDALIKAFHKIVMPMLESIWTIEDASQRLAASRDLLLPRLMSGQLSVAEAHKELEIA
jgi:type I restriction enzyme S subunit